MLFWSKVGIRTYLRFARILQKSYDFWTHKAKYSQVMTPKCTIARMLFCTKCSNQAVNFWCIYTLTYHWNLNPDFDPFQVDYVLLFTQRMGMNSYLVDYFSGLADLPPEKCSNYQNNIQSTISKVKCKLLIYIIIC